MKFAQINFITEWLLKYDLCTKNTFIYIQIYIKHIIILCLIFLIAYENKVKADP